MVALARLSEPGDVISLSRIADESAISRRYLEQLVIGLKAAALVRGKSGKGGGYSLSRPADDIKIRHIIESAIGPINIVDCVLRPAVCAKSDACECRMLYRLINQRITAVFDGLFLSDLADGERMRELVAMLDTELPAPSSGRGTTLCG